MKYSDNIDYLVASIIYLGTHEFYWARTPSGLGAEIHLDEDRLEKIFEAFPSIFRKSRQPGENGQHFYALQARYAQREGGEIEEPKQASYIAPLNKDKLDLLITFILKMTEHEKFDKRGKLTSGIAMAAALLSAATAVVVALLKGH